MRFGAGRKPASPMVAVSVGVIQEACLMRRLGRQSSQVREECWSQTGRWKWKILKATVWKSEHAKT